MDNYRDFQAEKAD